MTDMTLAEALSVPRYKKGFWNRLFKEEQLFRIVCEFSVLSNATHETLLQHASMKLGGVKYRYELQDKEV